MPAVTKSARTGSQPAPTGRERIFNAAVELVCTGGPAAATARAICEKSQITAPTLYHYFGDLYLLYDAVLQLMFVPEAQAHPGREHTDPPGMINYMWDCCVGTAQTNPGIVELKGQLISMGKVPHSMKHFYARLERAFEQLARDGALNFPPKVAATMFWSAAVGTANMIASGRHSGLIHPAQSVETLRSLVLGAVLKVAPHEKSTRGDAGRRRAP